jgi:hypothetical protein
VNIPTYSLNNPVNYTDPSGHIVCEVLGTEDCDDEGNYTNEDVSGPSVSQEVFNILMDLPTVDFLIDTYGISSAISREELVAARLSYAIYLPNPGFYSFNSGIFDSASLYYQSYPINNHTSQVYGPPTHYPSTIPDGILGDAFVTYSAIGLFDIGAYNVLKQASVVGDGLAIHHAVQSHPAYQIIPGYEKHYGPSIAIPEAQHNAIRN